MFIGIFPDRFVSLLTPQARPTPPPQKKYFSPHSPFNFFSLDSVWYYSNTFRPLYVSFSFSVSLTHFKSNSAIFQIFFSASPTASPWGEVPCENGQMVNHLYNLWGGGGGCLWYIHCLNRWLAPAIRTRQEREGGCLTIHMGEGR